MLVVHILASPRVGFDPLADLRILRVSVPVLVSAPAIWFLADVIDSTLWSLVIVPLVGFVVYGTAAVLSGRLGAVNCEMV